MQAPKKKILYVITKSNWGGAQRYVYDLVRGLSKEKFETAVVLGGSGPLSQRLKEQNIRIIPLISLDRNVNLLQDIRAFFELIKIFKKENPDVIHLNSSKAGGLGTIAGKIAGIKKIVFTAHGFAFNEERFVFSKILIWLSYVFIVLMSDIVFAVSKNIAYSTPLYTLFKKKIHIIYNGVQRETYIERNMAREMLLGTNTSGIIVGVIGELHKSKGFKYLIGAIKKVINDIPSVRLVILGEGEERKTLESMIEKMGLKNKVILKGFVDQAARYIKAFDVFAMSSITEALGYVLLEAGLAEVPVVATKVGGIPEIISNKNMGILVPPRNEIVLSSAIKEILTNKNYSSLCVNNLKNKIIKDFSMNEMQSKTYKHYI